MLMRRTTGLLLAATLVVFGGLMTVAPAASATSYSAYAWGYNGFGELGNGTSTGPDACAYNDPCGTTPAAVTGLSGVTAVSAGGVGFDLALLSTGTVEAWGDNRFGQLGDGTTTSSDVPVAVTGLSGVIAISAGGDFALALLSNGTVKAWGDDDTGQLGDGATATTGCDCRTRRWRSEVCAP